MTVQVSLEVPDVNAILEGLARVQENAARVQQLVRTQVSQQLQAAAEPQIELPASAPAPDPAA